MMDQRENEGTDLQHTKSNSTMASMQSPRQARFAEATSVLSPVDANKPPDTFKDLPPITTTHYAPQPQPSDVGFGYLSDNRASKNPMQFAGVEVPLTPNSPLKSALKSPGAAPRTIPMHDTILSPTFYEEQLLEKQEQKTEKAQAQDLKIKTRVRLAKMILRGTNFACSLIVLSMLSTSFSIFNATKSLPPRNGLPPWASNTSPWPQITVLVISCISLFMSVIVMAAYCRGSRRRAEKVAVYYTTFAVAFFVFSIVMWGVGAAVLQQSKEHSNGTDMWSWSCKQNTREVIYQTQIDFNLVCRLQNWSLLCCIIEVVVEVITILIYGVVFYRFYSKRRLHKSMNRRDTARSDLYLAQLRSQSAPNTPGLKSPFSPSGGGYNPLFSPRYAGAANTSATEQQIAAEEGEGTQYAAAAIPAIPKGSSSQSNKPFVLQPVPTGRTPKTAQTGFEPQPLQTASRPTTPAAQPYMVPLQSPIVHMPAAPGEQEYAPVPIPGSYAPPRTPVNTAPTPMSLPSSQFVTPMEMPQSAQPQQQQSSGQQSKSQYAGYFGVAR